MKVILILCLCGLSAAAQKAPDPKAEEARELQACAQAVLEGVPKIPDTRALRFQGKVSEATMLCRGGEKSLQFRLTPWVDWSQYWGTGDLSSLPSGFISTKGPAFRGVTGALFDLELQRIELIKFNLFDNSGTWRTYVDRRATAPEVRRSKPGLRCGCRRTTPIIRQSAETENRSAKAI